MQDFSLFVFINRMFNSKCYKENNLCDVAIFSFCLYSFLLSIQLYSDSLQTCGYILRQEAFLTETLLVSI